MSAAVNKITMLLSKGMISPVSVVVTPTMTLCLEAHKVSWSLERDFSPTFWIFVPALRPGYVSKSSDSINL